MVQTIAATTSRTSLTVHAELDSGEYPTGIRVSDDEIAALPITRHRFHGNWNYTLHPQRPTDTATTTSTQGEALADGSARLTWRSLLDLELPGMTRRQLNELIDVLTPAMKIQREQVLRTRRGHERLVAPGAGANLSRPGPGHRSPPAKTRDHGPPGPALEHQRHDHQPRSEGRWDCRSQARRCLAAALFPRLRPPTTPRGDSRSLCQCRLVQSLRSHDSASGR